MMELDGVPMETNERAARVEERCSHRVVGYVMEHPTLDKRAIVADGAVRCFPNDDEFQRMMGWKKYSGGPGVPHEGWPADEMPQPEVPKVALSAPAAPSRPVLTAPPTAALLESTEEALGALARELGCHWNADIAHNAGWFVPGKPKAYASAYDAIQGLVESLKVGGTVYTPPPAEPIAPATHMHPMVEPPASKQRRAAPVETNQESLF